MTCDPESARNVRGCMNSQARRVMPTLTVQPACCSPRSTSTALYAAMPPLTPSATFFSVKEPFMRSLAQHIDLPEIKDQCNIAETWVQRRSHYGLLQSPVQLPIASISS